VDIDPYFFALAWCASVAPTLLAWRGFVRLTAVLPDAAIGVKFNTKKSLFFYIAYRTKSRVPIKKGRQRHPFSVQEALKRHWYFS
jgi:hypothetical protein